MDCPHDRVALGLIRFRINMEGIQPVRAARCRDCGDDLGNFEVTLGDPEATYSPDEPGGHTASRRSDLSYVVDD